MSERRDFETEYEQKHDIWLLNKLIDEYYFYARTNKRKDKDMVQLLIDGGINVFKCPSLPYLGNQDTNLSEKGLYFYFEGHRIYRTELEFAIKVMYDNIHKVKLENSVEEIIES